MEPNRPEVVLLFVLPNLFGSESSSRGSCRCGTGEEFTKDEQCFPWD